VRIACFAALLVVLAVPGPAVAQPAAPDTPSEPVSRVSLNGSSGTADVSDDGTQVAYADEAGQLLVRDLGSGATTPVSDGPASSPSLSATGRLVAFVQDGRVLVADRDPDGDGVLGPPEVTPVTGTTGDLPLQRVAGPPQLSADGSTLALAAAQAPDSSALTATVVRSLVSSQSLLAGIPLLEELPILRSRAVAAERSPAVGGVVDLGFLVRPGRSRTVGVELANTGPAPVTLGDAAIEAPFRVRDTDCGTLAPEATCSIELTFTADPPSCEAGTAQGLLTVASPDPAAQAVFPVVADCRQPTFGPGPRPPSCPEPDLTGLVPRVVGARPGVAEHLVVDAGAVPVGEAALVAFDAGSGRVLAAPSADCAAQLVTPPVAQRLPDAPEPCVVRSGIRPCTAYLLLRPVDVAPAVATVRVGTVVHRVAVDGIRAVVLARRDLTGAGCFACPEALPPVVVSRDLTGAEAAGRAPSLSADGRFVAFTSAFEGTPQVYRHDTDAAGDRTFVPGPTVLVSTLPPLPDGAVPLPPEAGSGSVSGAGDRVAFTAVPAEGSEPQVYLADLTAARTVLVSAVPGAPVADAGAPVADAGAPVADAGAPVAGAGASSAPTLTGDGATVVFASVAPDLLEPAPAEPPAAEPPAAEPPAPEPAAQRVYARYLPDLDGGGVSELLSGDATDAAAPAADAHGRETVFTTAAPLSAGDANSVPDTYRHRRLPSPALAPAVLDFGPQPVGIAAAPRELTLTNAGPGPLIVTEAVPTGPFTVTGACPVVQRGESCALPVSFVPTAPEPAAGSVALRGPDGELVAQLLGGGTIPALPLLPPTARSGDATLVRATGFPANVPVTLTWRPGLGRLGVTTDATGAFTASMLVLPNDITGPRVLVVTFPGGAVDSGQFLVTARSGEPPF